MTFLRGRPWLVPSLLVIFIGAMQLVTVSEASHSTIKVVAGLLVIIGGGLILVSGEYGHRSVKRPRLGPQTSTLPLGFRQPPGEADVLFPVRRTRTSAARPSRSAFGL